MRRLQRSLITLLIVVGLTAIAGGLGLIFHNGLGMDADMLAGSPFSSYYWPGFILVMVVGGTHLLAAGLLWQKSKWSLESVAVAGFGMLIWVFTELYIINQPHWLQVVYFGEAVVVLMTTMVLLKFCTYKDF